MDPDGKRQCTAETMDPAMAVRLLLGELISGAGFHQSQELEAALARLKQASAAARLAAHQEILRSVAHGAVVSALFGGARNPELLAELFSLALSLEDTAALTALARAVSVARGACAQTLSACLLDHCNTVPPAVALACLPQRSLPAARELLLVGCVGGVLKTMPDVLRDTLVGWVEAGAELLHLAQDDPSMSLLWFLLRQHVCGVPGFGSTALLASLLEAIRAHSSAAACPLDVRPLLPILREAVALQGVDTLPAKPPSQTLLQVACVAAVSFPLAPDVRAELASICAPLAATGHPLYGNLAMQLLPQ